VAQFDNYCVHPDIPLPIERINLLAAFRALKTADTQHPIADTQHIYISAIWNRYG